MKARKTIIFRRMLVVLLTMAMLVSCFASCKGSGSKDEGDKVGAENLGDDENDGKDSTQGDGDSDPVGTGDGKDGTVGSGDGSDDDSQGTKRVPVNADGLDAQGNAIANFGSPIVDGVIDDEWGNADAVNLKKVRLTGGTPTKTTAAVKLLWDDNALYFLAEVKDANLSTDSSNVYEHDSVEVFLDQDNRRVGTYEADDSQFRINYKNELSCDHGDLSNLYTIASTTEDGYLVEGRIALSVPHENETVLGFDAQLNDATGATRLATMAVFDSTGTAYQNTRMFGQLRLVGKTASSVTRSDVYSLSTLVKATEEIELERYVNGGTVRTLINSSKKAIENAATKQAELDRLKRELETAVDALMHNDKSFEEKECRDIPKKYKESDPESQRGTIVKVEYNTNTYDNEAKDLQKYMLVYLPNGYDENDAKQYNVFYLIHGMSESQHTAFSDVGANSELMRAVDNLIADGKMEPLIIVTPTWYNGTPNEDGMFRIKNFHQELTKDIIPTIESKYKVYARSTSEKDLIAAREHRAVGGFSMGSACTWYNYIYACEYFKYYVPVSLWCWQDVASMEADGFRKKTSTESEDAYKAEYLSWCATKRGYGKDDIRIFCATGSADLAYGGMNSQIAEMKKLTDMFVYSADLRVGNFYYITLPGGAHNWTCVDRYLYNIMPDLFREYWTNDYGMNVEGNAVATFGSPLIDGEVDAIWGEARQIIPKHSTTPENTKASFRVMWDDAALYVLATVKDESISKASTNPYEQDSIEIFLDEGNHKAMSFESDDLQFRVNYAGERTADKGDIARLYSATQKTADGYVIEVRIAWTKNVSNDELVGLELQINDGKGSTRAGTINVFDASGNAWQNPSVFGTLLLTGRTATSVTPANPYALLSTIERIESLNASEYANWETMETAIASARQVAESGTTKAKEMEAAISLLLKTEKSLTYTEEARKVKRYVPVTNYEDVGGSTMELLQYTYQKEGSSPATKNVTVYLPAGYDSEDKEKKYNVLYLMHGGGENEFTIFNNSKTQAMSNSNVRPYIDYLIHEGLVEPMIIVAPTSNGGENDVATFHKELTGEIIPLIEQKYNTYYQDAAGETNADKMKATREHRAFGGFSMGSICTWNVFANCLDYIKYYIPLSGEMRGEGSMADIVTALEERVKAQGYNTIDGFKIFAATGDADIAYPNMKPMIDELQKRTETFVFDQDQTKGNCYFMIAADGTHAWSFVSQYLWSIFPDLFQ